MGHEGAVVLRQAFYRTGDWYDIVIMNTLAPAAGQSVYK